jgi:hypothetical protein
MSDFLIPHFLSLGIMFRCALSDIIV